MKSKFTAALAVAGCVLAVSPANPISLTSHLGATTTSVPGAVLFDDFDSIQNTAIGHHHRWALFTVPRQTAQVTALTGLRG